MVTSSWWCLYFCTSFCIKSKSCCKLRTWDCASRARSSASFPNSINASLSLSYNAHSFSNRQRWATNLSHFSASLWFSSTNFFSACAFIVASDCSKNPEFASSNFQKKKKRKWHDMTWQKEKIKNSLETLMHSMRRVLRSNWGLSERRHSRRRHCESWEARSLATRVSAGTGIPKESSMVCLMQLSTSWDRSIGAIDRTQPNQKFRICVWIQRIREKGRIRYPLWCEWVHDVKKGQGET